MSPLPRADPSLVLGEIQGAAAEKDSLETNILGMPFTPGFHLTSGISLDPSLELQQAWEAGIQ